MPERSHRSVVHRLRESVAVHAAHARRGSSWNGLIIPLFLGAGLLLLLALVSYTPADVPGRFGISQTSLPNPDTQNYIGIAGAIAAGYCYFLLGAASYLLAASLTWFGTARMAGAPAFTKGSIAGLLLLLVPGAALIHLQPWFFQDWSEKYNIYGAGGITGHASGEVLLQFLGGTGSVIVLTIAYGAGLILITGLDPTQFARLCRRAWKKSRAQRQARRAAAGDDIARLDRDARALRQEESRLLRQLKRSGPSAQSGHAEPAFAPPAGRRRRPHASPAPAHAAGEDAVFPAEEPEAPERIVPPPRIIDGSARRPRDRRGPPRDADAGSGPERSPSRTANRSYAGYRLPDLDLLIDADDASSACPADENALLQIQHTIVETLATFGIAVTPGDITRGPMITRFEIYPGKGLRINRIVALEADLARATRAERINIIAPIPGKDTVGIEIANKERVSVPLRELLDDPTFTSTKYRIPLPLGKDVYGEVVLADLAQMPHLLVAGATGSGKSVCINSIIASLLFQFTPDQLRFVMIDPKVVEMQMFRDLPHLVFPVVIEPKKVLLALRWVVREMELRYQIFAKAGKRNFESFNNRVRPSPKTAAESNLPVFGEEPPGDPHPDEPLPVQQSQLPLEGEDVLEIPDTIPYIVVIIDELADLMQTAPAEVETCIARLTQKARAAGIHLMVATQTPRVDVITGVIKANIPARIAFQVASAIDSRVILDQKGADKLVGRGDMLYLPPGTSTAVRTQGALVSDEEIQSIVDHCCRQGPPSFFQEDGAALDAGDGEDPSVSQEDEDLLEKCLEIIRQEKRASTSLMQRRLGLGYTRAARMMDVLEERGYIGPGDGAKPREILVDLNEDFG
ncbi:MAG TPA: DNA translocase FtsK 4TM domain-containing protein [Verrucomicrobiales bacterium]|nr:DNA translocase FtsK 4TM domain-containing protein [Verrucomicrobiales bacterium]